MNKKVLFTIIFFLGVIALSFYLEMHTSTMNKPMGVHHWRQSDCASMALNYYQNGMDFFNPEIHHMYSDGLQSGYAVSEFPILYYSVAILYKIFGAHDYIFKILNLFIFYLGLFSLFKLIKLYVQDYFVAVLLPLLVLSGSFVSYYANSYLVNSTALAFIFMGMYRWCRFYILGGHRKDIALLTISFLVAALLKITTLIVPLSILGATLWDNFKSRKQITNLGFTLGTILLGFILVIAWYWYVFAYNNQHGATYFVTHIKPIWACSWDDIIEIYNYFKGTWLKHMLIHWGKYFWCVAAIVLLIFYKKLCKREAAFLLLLFLGSISYTFLWYTQFKHHDYYIFTLVPFFTFVFVCAWRIFVDAKPRKWFKYTMYISFVLMIVATAERSKRNNWFSTYHDGYNRNMNMNLFDSEEAIANLGVGEDDKVICVPDFTYCHSLYLINRKGWTDYYGLIKDEESIKIRIEKGAKFLIISDSTFLKKEFIKPFLKNKKGEYKGISVYQLSE